MAQEDDKTIIIDEKAQESLRKTLKILADNAEKSSQYIKELLKDSNSLLDTKSKELQGQLELLKYYQEEERVFNKLISSGGVLTDQEKKRLEYIQQFSSLNEKVLKDSLRTVEASKKYSDSITNSLSSLTGVGRESNNFLGKMIQAGAQGSNLVLSFQDVMSKLSLINLAANTLVAGLDLVVKKTMEFAIAQDKAFAKFEREVGNVKAYENQIMQLRNTQGKYIVDIGDATEAFSAFRKGFSAFDELSKNNQDTLATTSAQLQKLGVATADVVRNQDIMIKSMGMSVVAANNLQKSLYATSVQMGFSVDKLTKDFAKASTTLVAHGKDMEKVFLDLEKSSRETGVEFDSLLNIANGFRTFDQAATAAGSLNAILGGDYFNSLQLVNANQAERIRLIKEGLSLHGESIQDMDESKQYALMEAMGARDLNDLHKIMNQEISKGTIESIKAEQAQKVMNEAIKQATELGQQWTYMLSQFSLAIRPVVNGLKDILSGINSINKEKFETASIIIGLTGLVTTVGLVIWSFTTFRTVLGGFKALSALASTQLTSMSTAASGLAASSGPAAAGTQGLAAGTSTLGAAAAASWQSILALGGAIALIGVGIGAAAFGLSFFVESFKEIENTGAVLGGLIIIFAGFAGVIYVLSGALAAFAAAGTAATPALLAFGFSILLIGTSIGVAAWGMSKLVESFKGLENSPQTLNAIASAMTKLLVTLVGFGIGMTVFVGIMSGLNLPLKLITITLLGFGAAMTLIGLGMYLATKGFSDLATSLKDAKPETISKSLDAMWESLSKFDSDKFSNLGESAKQFSNILDTMKQSAVALAQSLREINNIVINPKVNFSAVTAAAANFEASIKSGASQSGGTNIVPTPAGDRNINITLNIDGKVLAKEIVKMDEFKDGTQQVIKNMRPGRTGN